LVAVVGSFDELAVDECGAGTDECDQVRAVDRAPTVLGGLESAPTEVEFFLAHAPVLTPLPELIGVAGMRWKIEENNNSGPL
jgi:hypothetical protein